MKLTLSILVCFLFAIEKEYLLLNQSLPFFSGHTIENKAIDRKYFEGKVTLINFMTIGCMPCMKEMPFLSELQNEFPQDKFQVLCIAPHSREHLRDFNSDAKSPYGNFRKAIKLDLVHYDLLPECEISLKDSSSTKNHLTIRPDCDSISRLFDVDGYPMTFIIDQNLIIREIQFGYPMEVSDST